MPKTPDENRRYWLSEAQADAVHERHKNLVAWRDHPKAAAFIAEITPRLRTGMRVGELGCAAGYWHELLSLRERGIRYTGFDISPVNIARAKERYPDATFQLGDLSAVQGLEAFDYIFARQTFFFFSRSCVERIFQQLRPGALLTAQEPWRAKEKITRAGADGDATAHMHPYAEIVRASGCTLLAEKIVSYKKLGRPEEEKKKILFTCQR